MMDYSCGPDSVTIRTGNENGRYIELFFPVTADHVECKKILRKGLEEIEAVEGREWFRDMIAGYSLYGRMP